jgi:tetratricopeptide (TPR) repeat protein
MLTIDGRKSQIAVEFAYQFHDRHPEARVLWVYAANETRFIQAYREIAGKLQLPGREDPQVDVCKLVCEWLNETENLPWLMILDNADRAANFLPIEDGTMAETSTPSTYIAGYLPTRFSHSQFLLITTRRRDIGEYLSREQPCVDVGPLSSQEAGDLLRTKVRVFDSSDTPEVDNLVEILGRIPLAITQAVAFINRNKIGVQEYVRELNMDKQNFMEYLSGDLLDSRREPGFPNSVFQTWKLSFDQIRTDSPRAAEILSLMAWLDGQKIPEDLIRKDDERRVDFRNAIGTLDGYSMINKEIGGETCAIHPLIQLSVQYILGQSGQSPFYTGQALQLIAKKFPTGAHENKAVCESLLPHAEAVLQYNMVSDATASARAGLLHNLGWFKWQQARYELAYQNVQAAYQIRQKILGDEAGDTIASLGLLATVLQYQGKYEAAEEMNRRALAGSEKVLGVEHPHTLNSVSNLALVLRHQGKYEAAEEMNRQALGGYEKVLGVEHPHTLTSVSNLASVLQDQGKYEAAEEMNRRVLGGREKVLGVEHPETLRIVYCLAYLLHSRRQFQQASLLYQRALSGFQQSLGQVHPTTIACSSHYSSMLQEMENPNGR